MVADLTIACEGELFDYECELSTDQPDIQGFYAPASIDPSDDLPF